jgi:uncharacterized membrane protein (DUF485 family)
MFTDPASLFGRLLFVGLLIEGLEILKLRHCFEDHGLFSRATLGILTAGMPWQSRATATAGASAAVTIAMLGQALAATVVIFDGTGHPAGTIAAIACLLANGYLRSRRQIGGSGAEQLSFIVLVTFGLVVVAGGGDGARRLGDGFVAAQVVLAYLAAGVAKAASPIWRSGRAMAGILSTEGYGIPAFARLLSARPRLDKLLCWAVISWEIGFPLVLIAPRPVALALLATGVGFHVSCAIVMGLNRFVWAFCGCYPAVWATAMLLR